MKVIIYKDVFAIKSYIKNRPKDIRKINAKIKPYLIKAGTRPMEIEELIKLASRDFIRALMKAIDYRVEYSSLDR